MEWMTIDHSIMRNDLNITTVYFFYAVYCTQLETQVRLTSLIEKCKTSFIYFGRSLMIVNAPQSCPASIKISDHIGHDVNMDFHGVEGKSCYNQCKY